MYENKNHKRRGICLKSPEDVRRIATRIISDVFKEKVQIEQAGKVNNLLITWLKAWELQKVSDFEARLTALEQAKEAENEKP